MQKLGPYQTLAVAQLVAKQFFSLGEAVRIEESYEPYQRLTEDRYQAFVIRGEA